MLTRLQVESTAMSRTPELAYKCHKCSEMIDDARGYICANREAAFKRPARMRTWRKALHQNCDSGACLHPATDLIGCPTIIRWRTYHTRCDPNRDSSNYYRIDVDRCRSVWELLDWTAHLISKKWFIHTNWNDFLHTMRAQEAVDTRTVVAQPITRRQPARR